VLNERRMREARHEFRIGTRQLVVLGGGFAVICALTFALGVLVGRELTATSAPGRRGVGAATPVTPTTPVAGQARPAAPPKKERTGSDERLTFYQTLTAPTPDLPAVQPPKVEERIVPREAPAPAASAAASPPRDEGRPPAQPPARRGPPPVAAPTARPSASAAALAPEPQLWTVQVSSFRSRGLAEELKSRLVAQGFDAYLVSVATDEGRVRHRVRVGGYPTRAEAERVASELRAERNLNPFVTTRSR
jgi:cell division septation protein DedD